MPSVSVPAVLTVVLLLLGGSYSGDAWCYNEPQCAPDTWVSMGHCGGQRQSPINILSRESIPNSELGKVNLAGYEDSKKLLQIKNNGKTVEIELEEGLSLTGHGLPSSYMAKGIHLHWGDGVSNPGSEHTIDSKRYSMELHIVHTINNMNISDAVNDPKGIAVLGFFLEGSETAKSKGKAAEAWEEFIKNLQEISEEGEVKDLTSTVSVMDLLGTTNLGSYYRYLGSLTTPQCNEAVIWTLFTEPILVPPKVIEAFPSELRSTNSSSGPPIKNNFRPQQNIEGRKVERSAGLRPSSAASLTLLLFLSITSLASSLPV